MKEVLKVFPTCFLNLLLCIKTFPGLARSEIVIHILLMSEGLANQFMGVLQDACVGGWKCLIKVRAIRKIGAL